MGSAASNQVHSIQRTEERNSKRNNRSDVNIANDTDGSVMSVTGDIVCSTKSFSASSGTSDELIRQQDEVVSQDIKKQNKKVNEQSDMLCRIKHLEVELAKACSQNLDLEDQIQNLKELLSHVNGESEEKDLLTTTDYPEILISKDKDIAILKREIDVINSDSQKLLLKYKRRVKLLKSKLTEAQQTSQIQRIEMSNENNQLKASNRELKVNLETKLSEHCQSDTLVMYNNTESDGHKDRTNLVVELSAQLSEQSMVIFKLEETVTQKQKEIDNLKLTVKSSKSSIEESKHSQLDSWADEVKPHSSEVVNKRSSRKKAFKIGQRRCVDKSDKQLTFIKTVNGSCSDSDSDWTNDILSSKIHSAPVGVRAELTC